MTKKILASLLLCVCCGTTGAVVLIKKPAGGGATCTTGQSIVFWYGFEDGTCNTGGAACHIDADCSDFCLPNLTSTSGTVSYSAGDKTATRTGTPTISASAAKLGTYGGMTTASPDDYHEWGITSSDIMSNAQGELAFWYKYAKGTCVSGANAGNPCNIGSECPSSTCSTAYPGGQNLVYMRTNGGVTVARISTSGNTDERSFTFLWHDGTNTTTLVSSSITYASDTNGIGAGAWYYIVAEYNTTPTNGSDVFKLKVYNADGSLNGNASATDNSTATANALAGDVLRVGAVNGNPGEHYIDNLIISTDSASDLTTCKDQVKYDGS